MKGLVWHGKHELRLDDVREPQCGDGEAILEVKYAGICGSDLTIYHGKHKRAKPPTILGHEFAGVVVERRGAGHPSVRVGDRVIKGTIPDGARNQLVASLPDDVDQIVAVAE